MKLYAIRAERSGGDGLLLCTVWQGILNWTLETNEPFKKRVSVFPQNAANEIMIVIRDVVPKAWKLELVETTRHYMQDHKYYMENLPNV